VLEATALELLRLALEAVDRCEQAGAISPVTGSWTTNRYGAVVVHPCVAIERDSRLAAARWFRELALPDAPAEFVSPLQLRRRRAAG